MAGYDAELVRKVYDWLRTVDPSIGLASACCGHPTLALGDRKRFKVYQSRLAASLAQSGIKTLLVCCPNCAETLKSLPGLEILSIWPFMDRLKVSFPVEGGITYVLHDPCPTRNDSEVQEAFRRVMARSGVIWEDYPSNRGRAICCGKRNMLMALDPAAGRRVLARRVGESSNRNVLTYCFSCVQSFALAGCLSVHGLELFFGSAGGRGPKRGVWSNRIRTALLALKLERRGSQR